MRPPRNFKGNTVAGPQESKKVSRAQNMESHGVSEFYNHSSNFQNHFYDDGALEAPLGVNTAKFEKIKERLVVKFSNHAQT